MYDVNDYGRMMADPVRMQAYTEALRRAVKPGSLVLDVGTGTGVFAFLAARYGARKVYAIDTNPCIELARDVARHNGLVDRIDFIHDSIFDVAPKEKVDVLVMDCRGSFTLFGRHIDIIRRAREWVRPGGAIIPARDDLYAAIIEWPEYRARLEAPWKLAGLDWAPCRAEGLSSRIVAPDVSLTGARFLVEPQRWATVEFSSVDSANFAGRVGALARESGRAQFVAVWFVSTVAEGLTISSGPPSHPEQVYAPLLFPVEPEVDVTRGDSVTLRIDALKSADSYVFAWGIDAPSGRTRQMSEARAARALALNSV